jgi:hypothetical protein
MSRWKLARWYKGCIEYEYEYTSKTIKVFYIYDEKTKLYMVKGFVVVDPIEQECNFFDTPTMLNNYLKKNTLPRIRFMRIIRDIAKSLR